MRSEDEQKGQRVMGDWDTPIRGDQGEGLPYRLMEPLSQSESRVLRYLRTSRPAPEIAREL